MLNTGRTKDSVLATCLHKIWLQSAQGEYELQALHRSLSQANHTADQLLIVSLHISDHHHLSLLCECSLTNPMHVH